MRPFNKVFGIGFPRTGTCSLAAALYELGIPCVHYPVDDALLSEYRAACDITVAFRYKELDGLFPDSLFILTERGDNHALFNSLRKIFPRHTQYPDPMHDAELGHTPEGLAKACQRHKLAVRDHFAGRPGRLLILNIFEDPDPYATLSAFLKVERPLQSFPRLNSELIAENLQNILIRADGSFVRVQRSTSVR